MLCDNCKKNEAMISYTVMHGEEIEEVHLCPECAELKMKEGFPFKNLSTGNMKDFLKELFKLTGHKISDNTKICEECGSTFEDLKNNNLGCSHCYDNFKKEIETMLISMQSVSKHKGKIPATQGLDIKLKREEAELMNKLSVAIELEEYEEAAIYRDKLKSLRGRE